jgi:ribonuclease VapC
MPPRIVAVLTSEPEADALADILGGARSPVTSAIAIFQAILGICRKRHASVDKAAQDVRDFLNVPDIRVVPITERKGRNHPAQLNLGDCCLCCGETFVCRWLFKGEDFDKTDIPVAARL